jgi:uncharacterized protein
MRTLLPVIIILLLLLGLQWYAFQGIITVINYFTFSEYSFLYILWWVLVVGISFTAFFGFLHARHSGKISTTGRVLANAFTTLLVCSIALVSVLFMEDVYRFGAGFVRFFLGGAGSFEIPPRSVWVSLSGLVLSGGLMLGFIYGIVWGKYRYKVHRVRLKFPHLPAPFHGFKIVQISDIHAGSFQHPAGVEKGIKMVQQQNADLFVFTGDLVNNLASEIVPWIVHFSQIKAPYGQFSVLGNHDYGDYISWPTPMAKAANLAEVKLHHRHLGYRLLLDESVRIEKDGASIYLLGVENWGLGFGKRGNLAKALEAVPLNAFKVLLSHDPSHWEAQVKTYPVPIELTLSGHTHGMQFGFERLGIKWSPVQWRYKHWAGLKEFMGRYVYINRGFGFIGFNGRVGIYPEITVIELLKEEEK